MKNVRSIIEFHRLLSLPEPKHPLVSVVRVEDIRFTNQSIWKRFFLDFHTISLKTGVEAKVKYGQQYYDYDKGVMTFTAPKQVQSLDFSPSDTAYINSGIGYVLFVDPNFLYGHPIAAAIKNYNFFSYSINEALHLSGHEQENIVEIFNNIAREYQHIDRFTKDIIISQIELLLNYNKRFYERQFVTRSAANTDLVTRVHQLLSTYFDQRESTKNGLPTVEYLAGHLSLSPHYLSDMLRSLTGLNAQQHIHDKLIEKAKEQLSITNLSVSEIAFTLGFEYSQSFSKLFRKKTAMSPVEFRQSFD